MRGCRRCATLRSARRRRAQRTLSHALYRHARSLPRHPLRQTFGRWSKDRGKRRANATGEDRLPVKIAWEPCPFFPFRVPLTARDQGRPGGGERWACLPACCTSPRSAPCGPGWSCRMAGDAPHFAAVCRSARTPARTPAARLVEKRPPNPAAGRPPARPPRTLTTSTAKRLLHRWPLPPTHPQPRIAQLLPQTIDPQSYVSKPQPPNPDRAMAPSAALTPPTSAATWQPPPPRLAASNSLLPSRPPAPQPQPQPNLHSLTHVRSPPPPLLTTSIEGSGRRSGPGGPPASPSPRAGPLFRALLHRRSQGGAGTDARPSSAGPMGVGLGAVYDGG